MEYQPPPLPNQQPRHSFSDRLIGSVKLSRPIFDEVRRDPSAMSQAALVVVLAGLLSGISQFAEIRGQAFTVDDRVYHVPDSLLAPLASGIAIALLSLVFWVIGALFFRFVAVRILNSPEKDIQWQEVARPLGFASAPGLLLLLSPIPVIGVLIGSIVSLWTFISQLVAMSEVFQVSKLRAFATILIASILLGLALSLVVCVCVLAVLAVS